MTIYFARGGDRIKIGYTGGRVDVRLSAINSHLPVRVTLLASMEGGRDLERSIHHHCRRWRISGEWFRDQEDCIQEIKKIASGDVTPNPLPPASSRPQKTFVRESKPLSLEQLRTLLTIVWPIDTMASFAKFAELPVEECERQFSDLSLMTRGTRALLAHGVLNFMVQDDP